MAGTELLGMRGSAAHCRPRCHRSLQQPRRPSRSSLQVLAAASPSGDQSKKGAASKSAVTRGKKAEDLVKSDVETTATAKGKESQSSAPSSRSAARAPSASTTAKRNVDEGADAAKDAIDDASDAVKDTAQDTRAQTRQGARDLKENVDEGAEAVKEGVDDLADQVSQTASQVERNLDQAEERVEEQIDQAQEALQDFAERAPDQVAEAAQQAVDATADGLNAAQRALEQAAEPGPPSPYGEASLTTLEGNPFDNRPGPKAGQERQVEYYKRRLLYVTAGLDRGFAANPNASSEVESAVTSLVSATDPVVLSWTSGPGETTTTLAQLNGTWRLIYSSAFATGNLGGSAPGGGPAVSLVPAQLGQVYQTISAYTNRLDNVVELYARIGLPNLPGLPEQEPIVTTLTLRHLFEPLAGSTSQITFEDTEVKTTGGFGGWLGKLPEFRLPQLPESLRPSRDNRSSTFETLFLDDDLRISRGRNGELRIFLKT